MELLLLRAGHRKEERTSIARFLSSLNMEVKDKVKLLPYRDLDELVQLCIRVEQQLKRKPSSKNSMSYSYTKKDQAPSVLGVPPSKPKDDKGKNIEEITPKASSQDRTSNIKCFNYLYALSSSQIRFSYFLTQNPLFFLHTPKPITVKL